MTRTVIIMVMINIILPLHGIVSSQSWKRINGTENYVVHELHFERGSNDIRMVVAISSGSTFYNRYCIGNADSLNFSLMNVNAGSRTLDEIHDFCYSDKDGIFIADKDGVFHSSDEGASWIFSQNGLNDPRVNCISCDNNGGAYVGCIDGVYYYSKKGRSFSKRFRESNFRYITDIEYTDEYLFVVRLNRVYFSTNDGFTWQIDSDYEEVPRASIKYSIDTKKLVYIGVLSTEMCYYDIPDFTRNCIPLLPNSYLISLAVSSNSTYFSINTAVPPTERYYLYRYDLISDKLHEMSIDELQNDTTHLGPMIFDNNGRMYIGTNHGLYRTTEPVVTSTGNIAGVTNHDLSSYPNPVSSGGNISLSYSINHTASLNLVVQDILGRTVRQESLGRILPGQHTRSISTAGLEPGMYFYSFIPGSGKPMNGKMIVR